MKPIISISGIGKKYMLGATHGGHFINKSLRDVMSNMFKAPFRKPKKDQKDHNRPDHIWALKDISFDVQEGEVLGIIGRNGAGKSTLLKILSKITEPTEGEIRIRGRIASLLEVGTGFHPELSGRENIFLNGAILGMTRSEIKEKFDEIVDFAEIDKFVDTPVKRYSSGMYMRLAFAVAAHLEPEILLVDEVLAVGDIQFQKKCLGKLGEVAKTGRTVLFVSHHMGQIGKLCERVILLADGSVQRDGDSGVVVDEYVLSGMSLLTNKKTGLGNIAESDVVALKSFSVYGESVNAHPKTGKPLTIELLFNFKKSVKSPGIRVFIRDLQGLTLLYLTSAPFGRTVIDEAEGLVRFKLNIDELMLTGGQYILSIGVNRVTMEDYLFETEVCRFGVQSVDYYSVGINLLSTKVGVMAAKHTWSYEKEK